MDRKERQSNGCATDPIYFQTRKTHCDNHRPGHHNSPNTVSSSNTNSMMMNAPNNHHVLTPVPGDPSGRLVMTLLPSQGPHHDLMHGQHDPNLHHHSGASHTSSSHSTRYNHPG
ncbi:hypothetical protein OUZ56_022713 [Daphnia magna]|uniref:Uncharacterized protein n=1 Tax=Daphnia magna TaxID=35525 RepID=A0ABR0AXY6_9CRUS|nr:hypothetical protein OUZ56_022713 [Daphnia magna]